METKIVEITEETQSNFLEIAREIQEKIELSLMFYKMAIVSMGEFKGILSKESAERLMDVASCGTIPSFIVGTNLKEKDIKFKELEEIENKVYSLISKESLKVIINSIILKIAEDKEDFQFNYSIIYYNIKENIDTTSFSKEDINNLWIIIGSETISCVEDYYKRESRLQFVALYGEEKADWIEEVNNLIISIKEDSSLSTKEYIAPLLDSNFKKFHFCLRAYLTGIKDIIFTLEPDYIQPTIDKYSDILKEIFNIEGKDSLEANYIYESIEASKEVKEGEKGLLCLGAGIIFAQKIQENE